MLDAKVLNSILATEEIALVNTLCKKKTGKSAETDKVAESSSVLVVSGQAICSTTFFLPEITWQTPKIKHFQDYNYLIVSVISPYFSKNYPPPQSLVV